MSPIPTFLQARARSRRLLVAAGACTLALTAALAARPTPAHAAGEPRVFAFGAAADHGSPGPESPLAGMAATPSGNGYWTVTPAGQVGAYGDAPDLGSSTAHRGVVGIVGTHSGRGYLLALGDGGVLTFGDAKYLGSMGDKALAAPIVGVAATPSGRGYWLVASDGGIFSFGDAAYLGSMGGTKLAAPITGIASTPSGSGYWMVAEDGGIFSFGNAQFRGSFQGGDVIAMAASPRGVGYWLVTTSGQVHRFGDAPDFGNLTASSAAVDIAPRPQGDGFWLATGTPPSSPTTYHAASGDPSDSDWDRLAQCEASGNWAYRGQYEGGLQFLNSTWNGYGGGEFAQHAYDASREQQIEIGRRVWRARGWSAWPSCSRQLGYQ
ncbi:MAG: resuscitation-promoting factor RpfA [Actinomycetota bacterium]|nr:resuscitation-promoting factor RpfA [Actinomycetota bacterium]